MKNLLNIAALGALAMLPAVAGAQDTTGPGFTASGGEFGTLLGSIVGFTNGVVIPFILGIGFLVFVWGMFRYFIAGGADEEARGNGKNLMIWATLGFVLIIIFWGVVNLLVSTTGEGGDELDNIPVGPVPGAVGQTNTYTP